jgi:hypothetical protein
MNYFGIEWDRSWYVFTRKPFFRLCPRQSRGYEATIVAHNSILKRHTAQHRRKQEDDTLKLEIDSTAGNSKIDNSRQCPNNIHRTKECFIEDQRKALSLLYTRCRIEHTMITFIDHSCHILRRKLLRYLKRNTRCRTNHRVIIWIDHIPETHINSASSLMYRSVGPRTRKVTPLVREISIWTSLFPSHIHSLKWRHGEKNICPQ